MRWKKNSPPVPHLMQAQQASALLYAKVVGRPGTGSYPAPSPDPTTHAKGYMKIEFFGRHFVLKWTRLPLTDRWIGSEKGILHFSFTAKKVISTLLKKTPQALFKKNYNVWQRLFLYLQSIKATRAYLRLVYSCNCRLSRFISLEEIHISRLLRNSIFILTRHSCISL